MKILRYFLLGALIFSLQSGILIAAAATLTEEQVENFKTIYEVKAPEMQFPTVVETVLPYHQEYNVIVDEKETGEAQPINIISEYKTDKATPNVTDSSPTIGNLNALFDGNFNSTLEFDYDKDEGHAFIEVDFDKDVTISSFSLHLDTNVASPYAVEVLAFVDGNWKTILAKDSSYTYDVKFPTTEAKKWKIDLWHSQPLRLKEISFYDEEEDISFKGEKIIWLAKSGQEYLIYADAVSSTSIATSEKPNLFEEDDALILGLSLPTTNINYADPDYDEDGIPDYKDNCVYHANEDQEDLDENERGDICEDHDRDGVIDIEDNCPEDPNKAQKDVDNDGIGDTCDEEESRVTEKLPWLPWVAIAVAAGVVVLIIFQTMKPKK